ncbi:MAG: VV A32 virion packaging ATPase [Satyrvirus sp.]|uniref:VV A32 virion packaging ATPase n=1 Tax=Satyrvirus sp. TaxID=2487771 RepID=A0A3G5AEE6_9VIRU|nr:MAG: VV A32 virion packaging ATPase [Satyrvirus sp.]
MLAIVQTENSTKKIIGFVNDANDFGDAVEKYVEKTYGPDFHFQKVKNVQLDFLRTNQQYAENNYLVMFEDGIVLVKKCIQLNRGYIYNMKVSELVNLSAWTLMPVECKINSSNIISKIVEENSSDTSSESDSDSEREFENQRMMIEKINPTEMKKNPCILIVGKRASGKTTLANNLAKQICPNAKIEYYNKFDPIKLTQMLVMQELVYKLGKQMPEKVVILENMQCTRGRGSYFIKNAPNYNLSVIVTAQTLLGLSFTKKIDYVFQFAENSIINRKNIYNKFAPINMSYDIFDKIFTKCTSNFGCMVIDNNAPTDKIYDKIYWY